MDIIDPDHQHIQVWRDPAQHQGCNVLFFEPDKAAQEIWQHGMGKEVH
jgi:hypothetical protein